MRFGSTCSSKSATSHLARAAAACERAAGESPPQLCGRTQSGRTPSTRWKTQYAALFQGDGPYASTPGFRGSVLLVDEAKARRSQSLWDDRAAFDALAATDAYRESMNALAQECFVGAPEVVEHSFAGAFFPDGGAPM